MGKFSDISEDWSEDGHDVGLVWSADAWNAVKGLCPRDGTKLEAWKLDSFGTGYGWDDEVDYFECPTCGLNYNRSFWCRWSEDGPWVLVALSARSESGHGPIIIEDEWWRDRDWSIWTSFPPARRV